jgi:protein CpxP
MKTSIFVLSAFLVGGSFAVPMQAHAQAAVTAPSRTAVGSPAASRPGQANAARVEARIRDMHDKLGITAAQAPQWDAFVAVIRDNAQAERDRQADQATKAATMNAVEDLQSFATMADAHAASVKSLIPSFQAVYDSLSDAQKKKADLLFRQSSTPRRAK